MPSTPSPSIIIKVLLWLHCCVQNTPDSFYDKVMGNLASSAELCYGKLKDCHGLTPVMPKGAMYMMVSQVPAWLAARTDAP